MVLGVIGAMDIEVAKLKESMTDLNVTKKASIEFYEGNLNGCRAVVAQAGVGKVNAACCTQIMIDMFHVDCVVNTGIAGSLKVEINIGDIVLATDAVEHDMGAEAFGYPVGQIPGMDVFSFRTDDALRSTAQDACQKVNPDIQVFEGRVVTGDQFISGKEKKQWLVETFGGYCTEMEGAAIAHAAHLNEIPCLIVRAISDKADDSAVMDYPTFEAKAAEHSVNLILELAARLARKSD